MAKPIFAQLDHDLHNNPKVRRAGRDARDVFVFVLCKNASRGGLGWIPARYLEADYLADQLGCTEADAANGVARAVKAELIAIEGDTVMIVGWSDEYGRAPMSDAERQRAHRAAKRARDTAAIDHANGGASDRANSIETASRDASSGDGQKTQEDQDSVTNRRDMSRGHESHALDKIRVDEIRCDRDIASDREPTDSQIAPLRLEPESHPGPRASRKRPAVRLPEGWEPAHVAPPSGVDAAHELEKFRDWALAKDARFADWQAAWRNWLRNAQPRRVIAGAGPPPEAPAPRRLRTIA